MQVRLCRRAQLEDEQRVLKLRWGLDSRVQQALKAVPEDWRSPLLIWLALIAFIFLLKLWR